MAEIPGLLFARGADATLSGVGPSSAVPLTDRTGASTTIVPANAVTYLAKCHGQVVNEATADQWGELQFAFGGTIFGRGRSSFRFTAFGGNDASGGQACPFFEVTGNGTDQITATMTAEQAGSTTDTTGIEILGCPTSELRDYHYQSSGNGDTIQQQPAAASGMTEVASFGWTPDETTTYALWVYVELLGDGTEVSTTDEYAARVQVDGGTFQQSFGMDVALGYAAGETEQSVFWSIPIEATEGVAISVSLQVDGTLGNGNIGARRMRFAAFRGPGIYWDASSAGINANPGAAGTVALPGASVVVPDADEDVLSTCLGTFEIQSGNFLYGQFDVDGGTTFAPTQGAFRGISSNGVAVGNDHAPVAAQYSLVLADGAHTVGWRSTWVTAGTATWGRNRGNTADVPQHLMVIRWTESVDDPPAENNGQFAATLAMHELNASATAINSDPLAHLGDPFDYVGDPRDFGWSWFDLIPGGTNIVALEVDGDELIMQGAAGGAAGWFWFNNNDGPLLWREITGYAWQVQAYCRVLNAAGDGLPPVDSFRIGGWSFQDPAPWPSSPDASDANRQAAYSFIHLGLGAFNVADLRAEWKTNVAGVTTTGSISWPSGEGWIRVTRSGQVFTLEVSADGVTWTLVQTIDRAANPLPETLRFGPMVYAQAPTPNIQLRTHSMTVESTGPVGSLSVLGPVAAIAFSGDAHHEGALAMVAPVAEVALSGDAHHEGILGLIGPVPIAAFSSEVQHDGVLGLIGPVPSLDFSGNAYHEGVLTLSAPVPVIAFEGFENSGELGLVAPAPVLAFAGDAHHEGIIGLTAPVPVASFAGDAHHEGVLGLTAPLPAASFVGNIHNEGVLAAVAPVPSLEFSGEISREGTISVMGPVPEASFDGEATVMGAFGAVAALAPLPVIVFDGERTRGERPGRVDVSISVVDVDVDLEVE